MTLLQLVPWAERGELQKLAALLFPSETVSDEDARESKERAIAIITNYKYRTAYQIRNFIFIEATSELTAATLTYASLKKTTHLPNVALIIRAAYSHAISRFVTRICDKENSGMHKAARLVDLPPYLVDLRHAIVHRAEPSLLELHTAADDCLRWLKDCFWDELLEPPTEDLEGVPLEQYRSWITALIESYFAARKAEIKTGTQGADRSVVAHEVVEQLSVAYSQRNVMKSIGSLSTFFLKLLLNNRRFWPNEVNDATMATAFLMWDPIISLLAQHPSFCVVDILNAFMDELSRSTQVISSQDETKDGLLRWLSHILVEGRSKTGSLSSRRGHITTNATDANHWAEVVNTQHLHSILQRCIVEPGTWTDRLRVRITSVLPASSRGDYQEIADITQAPFSGSEANAQSLQDITNEILRMAAQEEDIDITPAKEGTAMLIDPTSPRHQSLADASRVSVDSMPKAHRRGWRLQSTPVIPRPIGVCRSVALEALLST